MKKQISYPKIQQFRNVVSTIRRQSTFVGLDENEEAIYDESKPKPILKFKGTVKLHGTNAAVCYNTSEGLWFQPRTRIITQEKDNAGFAFFAESKNEFFLYMFEYLSNKYSVNLKENTISIYGEWCGGNIQKGVALNQLEKSFFIFGAKVTPHNESDSYWLDISNDGLSVSRNNIYDINDFPTFEVEINFNNPELIQNQLIEITERVEKQCPVALEFGKIGIGEGVVWSCDYNGSVHRFKVKGELHSISKVKTLAPVDVEKVNNIKEFIEYAVTTNRLSQGISEVFGTEPLDIKKLGDLIRWVIKDVNKEESDVMVKNNLYPKDINKFIAPKVKQYFHTLE